MTPAGDRRPGPAARVLSGAVRGYQLVVSPWFAPTCRYYPSCSQYAVEALRTHGAIRGAGLAGWRLLRCNPWSHGGIDHVPPAGQRRSPADQLPRPIPTPADPPERPGGPEGRTLGSRTSRGAKA